MDLAILRTNAVRIVGSLAAGGMRGGARFGFLGLIAGGIAFYIAHSLIGRSGGGVSFLMLFVWSIFGLILGGIIGFLHGVRRVCRDSLVGSDWLDSACDRLSQETVTRLRSVHRRAIDSFDPEQLIEGWTSDQESAPEQSTGGFIRRISGRIVNLPQIAVRSCFIDIVRQICTETESGDQFSTRIDRFADELKSRTNSFIDTTIRQIFARPLSIVYAITGCVAALLSALSFAF